MPSTVTDRVTGLSTSVAQKAPVVAASTAALTLAGEQTIDGIALTEGDRVLVKDQVDTTANGIYDVSTGTWSRSGDFDGARDAVFGTLVFVPAGTANANTFWRVSTANPIAIGTSNITFADATTELAGVSAFSGTLLSQGSAANWLTELGLSAFIQTLIDDADQVAARTTLGAGTSSVGATQTWGASYFIETADNQDYIIIPKIPIGVTITETTTIAGAGTCTATFKINTTALGGTANSVSSSEQSQAHASANLVSVNDDLRVTVSSNSSCTDIAITLSGTYTLS